jgi:hypothetical protein
MQHAAADVQGRNQRDVVRRLGESRVYVGVGLGGRGVGHWWQGCESERARAHVRFTERTRSPSKRCLCYCRIM